ncbi:MAG: geranylgeranylglyceryl/heptaprenylglyceryl phosphate synthase [Candidatus Bathyarchaeota archaeon]|nr:geranylgeranylglyceryl/heptaprenylglyceryl phosphate synthase [Candidatus Bathyarchaeota archaeon]MDH5494356.1 geranylgeranylglyceryl/heptaprenylglyceryl phosphate synthase [Candidatus Bathyarchaeota archaeon]
MVGPVEKHLLKRICEEGAIHLTLVDPEKATSSLASRLAKRVESYKTAAIMVGGSTSTSTTHLNSIIKAIKRTVKIPVILFPNNVTGISKYADAIWFMSLLNSVDPYFLIGAQVLGAPMVKKYGLEALPLGYIIVGEGGTAGIVGRAIPIPYTKPELAAVHALAAQYFGMRFVYLEAGSGATQPVPSTMIKAVKHVTNIPLIVGGGIRSSKQAKTAVAAGADIVVTGNIIEETGAKNKFKKLVTTIRKNG